MQHILLDGGHSDNPSGASLQRQLDALRATGDEDFWRAASALLASGDPELSAGLHGAFDAPPLPRRGPSLWQALIERCPLVAKLTQADRHLAGPPVPKPDDVLFLALLGILCDDMRRGILMAAIASDLAAIARAVRGDAA